MKERKDQVARPVSGWRLLQAGLLRVWISMRRYPFNLFSGMVTIYLLFLFLFYGASFVSGGLRVGQTREGLVVGFIAWLAMLIAFQDPAHRLTQAATEGTLEQQALSPWGLERVVLAETLAANTANLVITGLMLGFVMLTTGQRLHVSVLDVVVPLALLLLQGAAFGLVLGGLALIFKRVELSFQIWQFLFIGFLVIPWETSFLVRFVPFTWAHRLLQEVMVGGARLMTVPGELAGAAAVSLGHFLLAWLVFRRFVASARRLARLGHY